MGKIVKIADVIRTARERKKMSKVKFAELVGVHRQTVYDWENGESAPNRKRAPIVADVLGITVAALSGDPMHVNVATITTDVQNTRRVPLIDWVNAGLGAEVVAAHPLRNASEYVEARSSVSEFSFALRVQGNSMEPEFYDGDVIIVDPHKTPQHNQYVVAELLPNGTPEGSGDVTLKRYKFRGIAGGMASFDLEPLNPEYPTVTINRNHPGRILGTVVEHTRFLTR